MPPTKKKPFDVRVASLPTHKSDLDHLILDYLIMQGFPKAAACFSRETELVPQQGMDSLHSRLEIKRLIYGGKVFEAIGVLNELDPEILEKNPALHFKLLRLRLVEMIRTCLASPGSDIGPAIEFATTYLTPRATMNDAFLRDLEKTMALVVFAPDQHDPEVAELIDLDFRRKVADEVNSAILLQHYNRGETAVRQLLKMRVWAEQTARDYKKNIPRSLDIVFDHEDFV